MLIIVVIWNNNFSYGINSGGRNCDFYLLIFRALSKNPFSKNGFSSNPKGFL